MDLDSYRAGAEEFVSSLDREYYLHYAGIKDEFAIEAIYDRHAALFSRRAVETVRDKLAAAPGGSDLARQRRMLLDFAVNGFLGAQTKQLEAEQARREAALKIELDGEPVGFRQAGVVMANEPDAQRRRMIEAQLLAATAEQLNPVVGEILERQHAAARELGFASYTAMCAQLKGYDLDALADQTARFLAESAQRLEPVVGPEAQRSLGLSLAQMGRADFVRFRRTPDLDASFPAARLLDSLYETVGGLGIDIRAQPNVHLDVEARANKTPRAFCAPVRSPQEVYLVIAPTGGRGDYNALFHEAGHTEHFAHVDPSLPFEFRYLGDNAITESFAFLFENLELNPRWLARRVGAVEPEAVVRRARAVRLLMTRRYSAKLAYELELHGNGAGSPGSSGAGAGSGASGFGDARAARYVELLSGAVGFSWPRENYLTDVDAGFYCSCYLRAWALETHLRRELVDRFGDSWFEQPAAGDLLREWWSAGQRLSAEEFLAELTGETLDFGVLVDDLALS